MTLVATPGTPNADSYFTLDEANAYFGGRNVTAWTGDDSVKEGAARRGTTYLDNQYRGRWIGLRATVDQALAWPRVDGARGYGGGITCPLLDADGFEIPADSVPNQIKQAAMEAALLALAGTPLEPLLDRGGAIKSIGKSVGPLRKDIVYMDSAPAMSRVVVIEGLLRGLVTGSPGASTGITRLVRG